MFGSSWLGRGALLLAGAFAGCTSDGDSGDGGPEAASPGSGNDAPQGGGNGDCESIVVRSDETVTCSGCCNVHGTKNSRNVTVNCDTGKCNASFGPQVNLTVNCNGASRCFGTAGGDGSKITVNCGANAADCECSWIQYSYDPKGSCELNCAAGQSAIHHDYGQAGANWVCE